VHRSVLWARAAARENPPCPNFFNLRSRTREAKEVDLTYTVAVVEYRGEVILWRVDADEEAYYVIFPAYLHWCCTAHPFLTHPPLSNTSVNAPKITVYHMPSLSGHPTRLSTPLGMDRDLQRRGPLFYMANLQPSSIHLCFTLSIRTETPGMYSNTSDTKFGHSDRVCTIGLWDSPGFQLEKVLAAMQEPKFQR
jgi:hypothetical protein